jgi:hypothetical protein
MPIRHLPASALLAVALLGAAACDDDDDDSVSPPATTTFRATLTGAAERPTPVTTTATGTSTLTLRNDTLNYRVDVAGINAVTMAHIHVGGPEVAGPIIVGLFNGPATTSPFSGTLTSGVITRTTAFTSTTIGFDSLLVLMRNGNAYVNVHTTARPAGEIRGQVVVE